MQREYEAETPVMNPGYSGIHYTYDDSGLRRVLKPQSARIWWDGNGKRAFHACNHHIEEWYDSMSTRSDRFYAALRKPSYEASWELTDTFTSPVFHTCSPTKTERLEPYRDPSQACSDAVVALRTRELPNLMNLPQAIIELKDVPKTLKGIRDIGQWLKTVPQEYRKGWFSRTTREVANGYLNAAFGVAPTMHDAADFLGDYPDLFDAEVKTMLNSVPGEPVRAFFRVTAGGVEEALRRRVTSRVIEMTARTSEPTDRRIVDAFAVGGYGSNGVIADSEKDVNTAYWPFASATAYEVPEVVGVVFGRVLRTGAAPYSVGDRIRVNSGLSLTAWELTPFSFVVDWFANLGKWLRQANRQVDAIERGYRLESVWLSRRQDLVTYWPRPWHATTCYVHGLSATGFNYRISTEKSVTWYKKRTLREYTRGCWDANPNTLSLPHLDVRGVQDQGFFQWGTGTALAIQACQGLK